MLSESLPGYPATHNPGTCRALVIPVDPNRQRPSAVTPALVQLPPQTQPPKISHPAQEKEINDNLNGDTDSIFIKISDDTKSIKESLNTVKESGSKSILRGWNKELNLTRWNLLVGNVKSTLGLRKTKSTAVNFRIWKMDLIELHIDCKLNMSQRYNTTPQKTQGEFRLPRWKQSTKEGGEDGDDPVLSTAGSHLMCDVSWQHSRMNTDKRSCTWGVETGRRRIWKL